MNKKSHQFLCITFSLKNFFSLNDRLRDYLTMEDFRESYPRHPSIEVTDTNRNGILLSFLINAESILECSLKFR